MHSLRYNLTSISLLWIIEFCYYYKTMQLSTNPSELSIRSSQTSAESITRSSSFFIPSAGKYNSLFVFLVFFFLFILVLPELYIRRTTKGTGRSREFFPPIYNGASASQLSTDMPFGINSPWYLEIRSFLVLSRPSSRWLDRTAPTLAGKLSENHANITLRGRARRQKKTFRQHPLCSRQSIVKLSLDRLGLGVLQAI